MPVTVVKDINVLALYVTNLDNSEAFYTNVLGFTKLADMAPGILIKAGNLVLYIEENRVIKRSGIKSVSEFSPCFTVSSVMDSYNSLRSSGVTISREYKELDQSFAFFRIYDPDGNQIEFAGAP